MLAYLQLASNTVLKRARAAGAPPTVCTVADAIEQGFASDDDWCEALDRFRANLGDIQTPTSFKSNHSAALAVLDLLSDRGAMTFADIRQHLRPAHPSFSRAFRKLLMSGDLYAEGGQPPRFTLTSRGEATLVALASERK